MRSNQQSVEFVYRDLAAEDADLDGVDDTYERALEDAVSEILMGWRDGWYDLAVTYDNADLQRRATSAYARGAKLGDIDAIIEYSDRMWEADRRAKALQVRSREPIPVPDEGPINPKTLQEKELVMSYWIEVCHRNVTEKTLTALADLNPEKYAPDYAYWLVEHNQCEAAINMIKVLIHDDTQDLYLPLGVILSEHGQTDHAIEAYTVGIAKGDYFSAFNLGLLHNELGDKTQGVRFIRLAASHGDRRAVRWLRSERRQKKRRKRRGPVF